MLGTRRVARESVEFAARLSKATENLQRGLFPFDENFFVFFVILITSAFVGERIEALLN